MKILSLETATAAGAVALVVDGEVLGERVTTTSREHTETLLSAADQMLNEAGLAVHDLDAIVVDIGPGLFTGLRVGVATARSLASASGVALVPVTSLHVLALAAETEGSAGVLAVVDARRGEVFAQAFAVDGVDRRPLCDPVVADPGSLALFCIEHLGAFSEVSIVGDGARRYGSDVAQIPGGRVIEAATIPSPAVAAQLVERGGEIVATDPTSVVPLYLRDPDAVANFSVARSRTTP